MARLAIIFFIIFFTPANVLAQWELLAPGLEINFLEAETISGSGSPNLAVVRIDPQYYRFQIQAAKAGEPGFTASQWQNITGAWIICNLGLYDENFEYLGLLVKDGQPISKMTSASKGLFLAEPRDKILPFARLVDLRYSAFDPLNSPYTQAAQSLMLLDRYGQIRVRKSEKLAHRTLIGQDYDGKILIMTTEGRHTLWELAQFLLNASLGLREVICLDGGPESQMVIKIKNYSYQNIGQSKISSELFLPWPPSSLPVVLSIFPRE